MARFWLKTLRREKRYTQKQMAVMALITQGYYSALEGGKRSPGVDVAKRIGKLLGFDWTRFYMDKIDKEVWYVR